MVVTCTQCGTEFEAKRSTAKYCSPTCRQRARRGTNEPGKVETEAEKVDEAPRPALAVSVLLGEDIVAATQRDLEAVGKLDSVAGRQAMVVAARMTLPRATGSEIAALSRELSRLMLVAVGRDGSFNLVDEVKRKRDEKLARARGGGAVAPASPVAEDAPDVRGGDHSAVSSQLAASEPRGDGR